MHAQLIAIRCFLSRSIKVVGLIALSVLPAIGAVVDIGPGQAYTSLGEFSFESLGAGDVVNIHYRAEPYREKLRLRAQGTPAAPMVIRGVLGPNGERPVLDGINATTRKTDTYSYEPLQDFGLVIIYRGDGDPYGYKPHDIVLEGIELRNAEQGAGNTFTDANGASRSWVENASGLWALGVENLVIRNCAVHNCGNGLFITSKGDEQTQSRNILVEGCEIYGNSVPGRFFEHNIYTEAPNTTFQYNYLGPVREQAQGGNLKERSARTIIRYNWIQGGQRLIDIVEAQDSYSFVGGLPEYTVTTMCMATSWSPIPATPQHWFTTVETAGLSRPTGNLPCISITTPRESCGISRSPTGPISLISPATTRLWMPEIISCTWPRLHQAERLPISNS